MSKWAYLSRHLAVLCILSLPSRFQPSIKLDLNMHTYPPSLQLIPLARLSPVSSPWRSLDQLGGKCPKVPILGYVSYFSLSFSCQLWLPLFPFPCSCSTSSCMKQPQTPPVPLATLMRLHFPPTKCNSHLLDEKFAHWSFTEFSALVRETHRRDL